MDYYNPRGPPAASRVVRGGWVLWAGGDGPVVITCRRGDRGYGSGSISLASVTSLD